MSKVICNALCFGSAVLAAILVLTNSALAVEAPVDEMAVTSVSQLSDVRSTDWTFQAIQSLIERYGVVAGNFDGTFRGNRSITRYEFAAILNAVIKGLNELITTGNADRVQKKDLATLKRLQKEFATELGILRGRVGDLEAQTTQLEAQQFSTTTRLTGEALFAISGANGGEKVDDSGEEVDENLILSDRVRLNFNTSFTGSDRLRARLEAENTSGFDDATATRMARLGFEGDNENTFELTQLDYRFLIGEQAEVYIATAGGEFEYIVNTLSPFSSSGSGAISRFGRYNPIYRQGFGAGVGISYEFSDAVSLSLGYIADEGNDPESGIGSSPYGAIFQLTLEPIEDIEISLTYIRSDNNLDTGTGSELANDPFDDESDDVTANSYGLEASFQVNSDFTLGGWVGFTEARAEDLSGNPEASIFNYAVLLAFPDLGKEGSLAGIVIGQPPKVTSNDLSREFKDEDTSLHLEFFYRFHATDNIAITPGLFALINPEHDKNNDTIYVGTVRTTFSF